MGEKDEDEDQVPEKEFKDSCCKKILRFFFSIVGLFILLGGYTVAGAAYFGNKETELENLAYKTMLGKALDLNNSVEYVASDIMYVAYGDPATREGSYNNCTVFTDDPYWTNGTLHNVCLDQRDPAMNSSRFCHCVWVFKARFEQKCKDNLFRLVKFVVNIMSENNFNLDMNTKEILWEPSWDFVNSLLFCMTTLTLIGYGHISPSTEGLKSMCIIFTIIGLPLMMVFLANIGGSMAKGITWLYSRACCRWCRVRRKRAELPDDADNALIHEKVTLKDEEVGEELYMPSGDILVPIVLTLTVMITYMILGAGIFAVWEDWSLLDGFYFSFITLTTIGFGDFVPGANFKEAETDLSKIFKLLFTTFYCLLGLALIAMGISLVSEQVKMKFASDGSKGDMDRYILKKHFGVRETPSDKTGLHTHFGGKKKRLMQEKKNAREAGEDFSDMSRIAEEDDADWEHQVMLQQ